MTWKEEYLSASFRSIPFFVKRASFSVDHKLIAHIFPSSDLVEYEDQGIGEFNAPIDCFLLGEDYLDQRDKFEAALLDTTVGILVHPYRGVKSVRVASFEGNEEDTESGIIRYSVKFLIIPSAPVQIKKINTDKKVLIAKESVIQANNDNFSENYSLIDKIYNEVASTQEAINSGIDQIDRIKEIAKVGLMFQRFVEDAKGKLIQLSLEGASLTQTFGDLINYGTNPETFKEFGATVENSFLQLLEAHNLINYFSIVPTDIPKSLYESENYSVRQFNDMARVHSLAALSGLVVSINYDSTISLNYTKNLVFADLKKFIENKLIPDFIYSALLDLMVALNDFFTEKLRQLPSISIYHSEDIHTTLNLLYLVNGSVDDEEYFLSLNDEIFHPGFIPSGIDILLKVGK